MQGHDFRALKSAGKLLAERVHYIMGEVWIKNGCARTQPASRRHVHGALRLSSGSALDGTCLCALVCRPVADVYQGVSNDFCRDLLPYMRSIGYEALALAPGHKYGRPPRHIFTATATADAYCNSPEEKDAKRIAGLSEGNAFWRVIGTSLKPPSSSEWPSALRPA